MFKFSKKEKIWYPWNLYKKRIKYNKVIMSQFKAFENHGRRLIIYPSFDQLFLPSKTVSSCPHSGCGPKKDQPFLMCPTNRAPNGCPTNVPTKASLAQRISQSCKVRCTCATSSHTSVDTEHFPNGQPARASSKSLTTLGTCKRLMGTKRGLSWWGNWKREEPGI